MSPNGVIISCQNVGSLLILVCLELVLALGVILLDWYINGNAANNIRIILSKSLHSYDKICFIVLVVYDIKLENCNISWLLNFFGKRKATKVS